MNAPVETLLLGVVEDAPAQLVKQFADPFDCLRELLQNAIDAGTSLIEVTCTFEEKSSGPHPDAGTMVLRVADYGEGMDRHVIDTRLTRLFSSHKLHDRTRIGKFGIGFVSVFAMQPNVVCVDTGKHGESWRLVFRPDRTFVRVYLSELIEGTTVRLFKTMTRTEFQAFEPQVRAALLHHGRNLEVPLHYQGEAVNTPLRLSGSIQVTNHEHGATIVVGYTKEGRPDTASFYNRGLTLLVRPSELAGVSYKISSPRLEHTFGRDNVVQDDNYYTLMAIVRRLAGDSLVDELSRRLDEGLRHERPECELSSWLRQLAEQIRRSGGLPPGCGQRAVARSPHGELFTLEACQEAARKNRLFYVTHPSPLSAAAAREGRIVVEEWLAPLIAALCQGEAQRLEQALLLPLSAHTTDEVRSARNKALGAATLALLHAARAPVAAIEMGYLDYPGSGAGRLVAVVQAQPFTVSFLQDALPQRQHWDEPPRTWVLNADHPGVKALLPLAESEPELAAYNLVKLCLLGGALTPELDSRLLTLAMEKRCHRQEAGR